MKTLLPGRAFTFIAVLAVPTLAQAHPGHAAGDAFVAGALHPILGVDHLIALVAVGLLAWRMQAGARWTIPAAFIALMGVGVTLGLAGFELRHAELAIVASCGALALLARFPPRRMPTAAATLAGAFALFHGYAHGAEAARDTAAVQYVVGLLSASAAVIGAVLAGASRLATRRATKLLQLHHRH